jgi:hypothetical protein
MNSDQSPNSVNDLLTDQLSPVGIACGTADELSPDSKVNISVGSETYQVTSVGIDTRIQYQMGWNMERTSPIVQYTTPDVRVISGPLLKSIRTSSLLINNRPLPAENITDRIVLIGTSHGETGDVFDTPLGEMPGSVLIANAVKSFVEYGPLQATPVWQKIIVVLALNLLAFGFFKYCKKLSFYDPILFKQLFLALNALLWTLMSLVILQHSVWVDILFPQYAVSLYYVREDIQELKQTIRNLKVSKGLKEAPDANSEK